MSLIARLAGIPLSAVGPVGWAFTPGGRPHIRTIEVSNGVAAELEQNRGKFVALEIEAEGFKPLKVQNLLLVDIRAGKSPFTRAVMVADKRYLWRRKVIVRDFNLRRRTGETRLSKESRIETQQPLPTIAYAPWSLNRGNPYDASAALLSVIEELDGRKPFVPFAMPRQVSIENLLISDTGDVAVEKILAHLAGLGVWIDANGDTQVYDTRNGAEAPIILNAGAPIQGRGFHGRAVRSAARPRRYHILMERECEIRFDFVEADTTNTSTTIRGDDAREPRSLENVILQPDASLLFNGATVARGTIIEMNAWLAALSAGNTHTRVNADGPLDQAGIRYAWLQQWPYYMTGKYGVNRASGQPDAEWMKRLQALRGSWRRLFRVLPKWRDKMRSMKAYRLGTIDPTTGTRARTEPYMDYIVKPSATAQSKNIVRNPDIGSQVSGWAERLENGVAAPALVTVLDEEAGLFQVTLQKDSYGDAEDMAPGNVAKLPTHRVSGDFVTAATTAFNAWGISPLLSTFKMAVVLTCIQGSPNNAGRYHKVTVEPKRAEEVLGVPIGDCFGEEATVFVPAGDLTARFMWSDDFAGQIEDAFFLGTPMPASLLTNALQVKAVAEATAAREWATYLDREECSMSVALNADVVIDGAIAMVDHTIMPGGPPLTTIITAPELQPVPRDSYIPTHIQNAMRHLVQP